MEKLVFAIQVFGLITMFPVVMILELNHTNTGVSAGNSTSGFKKQTEMKSFSLPEQKNHTIEKEVFSDTRETFLLFKAF